MISLVTILSINPTVDVRMAAKAVLTCRTNSHPFQERSLILDQPAKIGRSVARARPNGTNAIFDCKVLSRNHALLWHENGKFFLQDTKSSNGTFVNNQRLSKSSEESAPREVCSGDIVQFGVDVMEVNKKLTHGCIVANLQLFLPDGKEAKASSSTTLPEKASNTPLQDVYLLNQYIKESMQKEQMIEHKLAAVTKLVLATKESMGSSWKSMIEEDRLLTRIDILERQIETSHKTMTDEKLREEVTQLHEDKEKYQTIAKEALRKSMQEKMDVLKKYQELERGIQNYLKEKELYKQLSEKRSEELQDLAERFEKSEEKSQELEEEIASMAVKYKDEIDELNQKLKEEEDLLNDKQKVIDDLISKVEPTIAHPIIVAHNDDSKVIIPENDINPGLNSVSDMNNRLISESGALETKEKIISTEEELAVYQHRFNESAAECAKLNRECLELRSEHETLSQNSKMEKELYKQLSEKRSEELQDLAERFEKSEEKSQELENEVAAMTVKHKVETDELSKKLKEDKDLLNDKQKVIDDLISKVEPNVARSILVARNDDSKVIVPENNSNPGFTCASDMSSRLIPESDALETREKLISTEEELAVYKHRFSESAAECARLNRECLELRSEHKKLSQHSNMVQLRYIIPIVIMILAVLIVFHPSS